MGITFGSVLIIMHGGLLIIIISELILGFFKGNKMAKSIWYFSKELFFNCELNDQDEAQALLDYEFRQGRLACMIHEGGRFIFYTEKN